MATREGSGLTKVRKVLELEKRERSRAVATHALRCAAVGRTPDALSGDEGDLARTSVEERLEHIELLRITSVLRHVEAAIKTIDNGRYGICQHCEEPIPRRRLRVLPMAILCRECQEAAESVREACRA